MFGPDEVDHEEIAAQRADIEAEGRAELAAEDDVHYGSAHGLTTDCGQPIAVVRRTTVDRAAVTCYGCIVAADPTMAPGRPATYALPAWMTAGLDDDSSEQTLTAEIADGEVHLMDDGETFEFEGADSPAAADEVLARYRYRRTTAWTSARPGVLFAGIEPLP